MTKSTQVERIAAILREIETNIGRPLAERIDELAPLVDAVLECPLSEDDEAASVDVSEVLLHLGVLTGDE
jgi:hypothetical protein